jgi:hypothetical protein
MQVIHQTEGAPMPHTTQIRVADLVAGDRYWSTPFLSMPGKIRIVESVTLDENWEHVRYADDQPERTIVVKFTDGAILCADPDEIHEVIA